MVRINVGYMPVNCCSTSIGVDSAVAEKCLHAMLETAYPGYITYDDEAGANEERGPKASQIKAINDLRLIWQEFFGRNGKLHREVQEKYIRGGFLCRSLGFIPKLPLLIVLWTILLPLSCSMMKKRIKEWNVAMVKFVDELNQKLQPFGFFVKTQSNCVVETKGKELIIPNTFFYPNNLEDNKNYLLKYAEGPKGEKHEVRVFDRWFAISLTSEDSMQLQNEPHLMGEWHNEVWYVDENKLCMHPMEEFTWMPYLGCQRPNRD